MGKCQPAAGQSRPRATVGKVGLAYWDWVRQGPHVPAPLQPEYIALESLSQDYGFELLGMCRNQSEVTAVLNDQDEDNETEPEAEGLGQAFEEGIPNLARLRLAVNYNQKRISWALPTSPTLPPSLPGHG